MFRFVLVLACYLASVLVKVTNQILFRLFIFNYYVICLAGTVGGIF